MSQQFYAARKDNHVLHHPALPWHWGFYPVSLARDRFPHLLRAEFKPVPHVKTPHCDSDMPLFLFLWSCPLQLLPLCFRKVTFHRLFSEQKRCGFFILSVIQTWGKSTYALLDLLETVRCIHASLDLCLQCNGTAAYLFFIITPFVPDCDCPESSSPVNSTKIARISTWARHCASCWSHMTCYLSTKNKWGIHMLTPWCPLPSYTSGQCHCLRWFKHHLLAKDSV